MLNRHGGGFTPSTMIPDAQTFRAFYASPKGELARGVIGQRLGLRLQVSQQQRILGLGYTVPYLDTFSSTAKLVIAAQPANMGVAHGQSAVLVEDETLPFADALFDWVIAVHAIELERIELGETAASLIKLNSFQQKVMHSVETVGGPAS